MGGGNRTCVTITLTENTLTQYILRYVLTFDMGGGTVTCVTITLTENTLT
jgi:hypothetical protein